jgi:hypothetical protein
MTISPDSRVMSGQQADKKELSLALVSLNTPLLLLFVVAD